MAHEMHDTGLHGSIREGRVDRVREPLETVHDGNQDILNASVLQIIHD